jgi:serine/threonine protein kinase
MLGTVFLKQYQAISLLGKGSMGTVFLARHLTRQEVVVVKVMNREAVKDPSFRQFFDSEIETLTQLRHPCIVSLLDSDFRDPSGPCLIMEFIPGITLEKLLERHKQLKPDQVFRLLIPLCQALSYGHARHVTHRDLKPANLMVLDPDTSHESLKIMDFGLAQLAAKPHIPLAKLKGIDAGDVRGTPIYVAPEGLRGDPVDYRADLYSVGVTLFELLTGTPPFNHSDSMTILHAHVHSQPPSFAKVRPGLNLPPEVEAVVRRCLEKYPNERFQSAKDIAAAFARAIGQSLPDGTFEELPSPAPQPVAKPMPAARPLSTSPHSISSTFDAWMPEPIAVVKLRGFVDDAGGQILESEPGRIRVRIGGEPAASGSGSRSLLGWFGREQSSATRSKARTDSLEMVILLNRKGDPQSSRLEVTVCLNPVDGKRPSQPFEWQVRCQKFLDELRAYLMAK